MRIDATNTGIGESLQDYAVRVTGGRSSAYEAHYDAWHKRGEEMAKAFQAPCAVPNIIPDPMAPMGAYHVPHVRIESGRCFGIVRPGERFASTMRP